VSLNMNIHPSFRKGEEWGTVDARFLTAKMSYHGDGYGNCFQLKLGDSAGNDVTINIHKGGDQTDEDMICRLMDAAKKFVVEYELRLIARGMACGSNCAYKTCEHNPNNKKRKE